MKLKSVRKWPVEVPSGAYTVKIYRVRNKKRRSFMVSYFVGADRKQKMFVDCGRKKRWACPAGGLEARSG
jgi:hypothetical protein